MLEKTEWVIKNGQSRDKDNIGHKDKQTKNATQKNYKDEQRPTKNGDKAGC